MSSKRWTFLCMLFACTRKGVLCKKWHILAPLDDSEFQAPLDSSSCSTMRLEPSSFPSSSSQKSVEFTFLRMQHDKTLPYVLYIHRIVYKYWIRQYHGFSKVSEVSLTSFASLISLQYPFLTRIRLSKIFSNTLYFDLYEVDTLQNWKWHLCYVYKVREREGEREREREGDG